MRFAPFAAAVCLGACAMGSGRVETMSHAPSFHARILALASLRGADAKGPALTKELVRRLQEGGFRVVLLEDSDSVLAGSAVGLDVANDPHVLSEIRRATDADAVVFVNMDPGWHGLDVSVLDATTGDVVLRATGRPRGDVFETPADAAGAAAEALSSLSADPRKAAAASTAAGDASDEIPVP
jgi:hypothetical protein